MTTPSTPKKALIIKPSSLGDIVHGLPVLDALKRSYPTMSVHWVVAKGLEGLLEGHPLIDKLWVINKDQWSKPSHLCSTLSELRGLYTALKAERFDLAVDLQGLLRSGLITWATHSAIRIGFEDAREGSRHFYTHRVHAEREMHAVDRNMKVAVALGADASLVHFPMVSTPYSAPFPAYAVMAVGARWVTKQWAPERFGELAARLPLPTLVVGGASDLGLAERVVASSKGKAHNLAGKTTLKELAGVIKAARYMVCNDSGPMHMAAAFEVPVFALFGPTNPTRTGPYGKLHTVITSSLSCMPCYKKSCTDLRCMEGITVDKVHEAIATKGFR